MKTGIKIHRSLCEKSKLKRELNILHLVLSLQIGGAERVVCDLLTEQNRTGLNATVCCLDKIGTLGAELKALGHEVDLLKRKSGIDWMLLWRLRQYYQKRRIDIIHTHGESPWFYGVLSANLLPWARIPCLTTIHGYSGGDRRELKRHRLWKCLSFLSVRIVSVSNVLRHELEAAGLPAKKLTTIINGIDTVRFDGDGEGIGLQNRYGISPDEFVVGIVARLSSIKNHVLLFRAFSQLRRKATRPVRLMIIGDGPERVRLQNLAAELQIRDRVIFCGEQSEVEKFYTIFDVFVLPSFSEGISMTLLEAMASGVPVVASSVGGNTEVIVHGKTGFLFPSNDLGALLGALVEVMQNKQMVARMVKDARKMIDARFSLKAMSSAYRDIYYEIMC